MNEFSMKTERAPGIVIVLLSICLLLATGMTSARADGQTAKTEGTIHQRIAGMSDAEVRKLLITQTQELEATAGKGVAEDPPGPGVVLGKILNVLERQADDSQSRLQELAGDIPNILPELSSIFVKFSSSGTRQEALKNILWVLLFIGIGLLAEKIAIRLLRKRFYHFSAGNLANPPSSGDSVQVSEKLTTGVVVLLPAILGLFVFCIAAYASFFTFFASDPPSLKLLFLAVLLTITIIRMIAIVAGMVLSPSRPGLRLVPLSCAVAGSCCRFIVWTLGYIVTVSLFGIVIRRTGIGTDTVILIQLFAATVLLAIAAAAVVLLRKKVTAYILAPSPEDTGPPSLGKSSFAAIWHILTLLYLAILWCLLITNILDRDIHTKKAFLISFFILPIWLVADQVLQWLVKYIMISLKMYDQPPVTQPSADRDGRGEKHQDNEFFGKAKLYARLALVLAVGLWVASLWGYTIPFISKLSDVLFDSLLIMTVALLFWQFINAWIERKINESLPADSATQEDIDDEWGATTAQGRAYTLLPIIRSFVASILIIMVTLTILSSMGVDIGPLLAGAGVVGLAVGFGAQKIVSDIFSGIFYLLDDAFRVGEYLSAGSITGTVERISLRNVMLRHHRGMLQIVPHSQLGTITNYMRGGIIEKFSLDFAYDADIDKIRKIIKRVGLEMLEDPELGKGFLRPLRSQGVSAITNSVMTIRVKFTAKPGTQFVIRREAYKRITLALQTKGIHYAHKKVIVDLPGPMTGHEDAGQMQKIAQAAGAAAREIFDDEEKLKQQLAKEQSGG